MENHPDDTQGRLTFPRRLLSHFFRIFFHLLYHQLAGTYDLVASAVSLGSWRKWILSVTPFIEGPRVLEIGFGPGHLQKSLSKKEICVVGLDESKQMARLAHSRLVKAGIIPNFVRGDARNLPFEDDSFNQVVLTFPAEFIFRASTISEIHRVLAKGGSAVILPLAWITGRKPVERMVAWVNRITGEAPQWDTKFLEPLHQSGFEIAWEMIDYPNSRVVIVRLHKT